MVVVTGVGVAVVVTIAASNRVSWTVDGFTFMHRQPFATIFGGMCLSAHFTAGVGNPRAEIGSAVGVVGGLPGMKIVVALWGGVSGDGEGG